MFIFTAKVNRKKIILGAAAVVVLCGVLAAALSALGAGGAAVSTAAGPKGVKSNDDRVAYLESYGWTVVPDPISVEELVIPDEFDETYTDYLALQAGQGFDLSRFNGKRVKRYAYIITNYPTGEEGVQAGLLVYKNTVIGGEVLSSQIDGFIHGLALPN